MDRNHHFTGDQQAQYDSLAAKGRSFYDEQRWHHGATHDEAYASALAAHGTKHDQAVRRFMANGLSAEEAEAEATRLDRY
jgi:hypothetical protein